MINNGAILIRYGHSVFVKNSGNAKITIETESYLPILAQRLIAELHRSPTLLDFNNNNSFSTINVKNKYFEAHLSCVLVDDNLVVVHQPEQQQEQEKCEVRENTSNPFTSSQDVIASLRCGRIPYGLVQIVDMAQLSTQTLLTDQECVGRNNSNENKLPHAKNKFDAPLFNLCLVVASASSAASSSNNNSPLNLLQPGQQQQYQKWKEICVDLGIECVPWILASSDSSSTKNNNNNHEVRMSISRPDPPPVGIEKRGLLQSMKDGELTGSSRVLEVLNQSLWCTFDPMLAMKVKERTLLRDSIGNNKNNTVNIFEGIYHENLIGLVSSSRFTCEFSKNILDRVPGIQETKFLSPSQNSDENNNNYLFVGSGGDDQNFSATFQLGDFQNNKASNDGNNNHKKMSQQQVADLNIYFSPLQMMTQNSYLNRLGAAEIEKMLGIQSCKLICFHLLMTDIVALFPSSSSSSSSSSPSLALVNALTSIRNILQLLGEEHFTKRIKLGNDLGCFILVQNNLHDERDQSDKKNLLQNFSEDPIVFDLMQLGCETVVVNDETDDGKLWDKEEGAIGLNRIGEILSCLSSSWKSNVATKTESIEKRRLKSPLEQNAVVLVSVGEEYCFNNNNNNAKTSLLASFIAKSFSDDNEETLSSAHDKKTQWLKKEILLSSPSLSLSLSVSVYSVDLSTKYYCANVDVIVVKVAKSPEMTLHEIQEEICTILDITNAQVFLVHLNQHSESNNSKQINEVQLLLENTCLVKEDDDDENDDDAVDGGKNEDSSAKHNIKFPVGPHSDKIALVVIDNSKNDFPSSSSSSSLQEYCQENFIEFITTSEDDEQREGQNGIMSDESRKSMTLTQKIFDTLSCVDWKNVSKRDRPAVTSTIPNNFNTNQKRAEDLLLQNIHDGTEGYYSETASESLTRSTAVLESNKNKNHKDKNSNSQTSSSAIELAMKAVVNSSGAAESTGNSTRTAKNNTNSVVLTCEIPKSTHRYDRVLKKTVLRRNEEEVSGKSTLGKKNENDDSGSDASSEIIDDDNDMSELLQQMRDVRDSKRLTREERQLRAEELSKQFAKKLHKDDDLADALVKNLL